MRLWTLHPSYLDTKGLVAVWREGLLALHVLRGQTRGYTQHPQLLRFQAHPEPIVAISNYLHAIADEADQRQYDFNRQKLEPWSEVDLIPVTQGQVTYEAQHLLKKLAQRAPQKFLQLQSLETFMIHPMFTVIEGEREPWEKVTTL
jgi:hypothetical protein